MAYAVTPQGPRFFDPDSGEFAFGNGENIGASLDAYITGYANYYLSVPITDRQIYLLS
jgi:hypothetical protein